MGEWKPGPDDLFSSAFKATPIGIAIEDLEGRPLFANPALCAMLGYTEEQMRGKHCVEFSPPEDARKDWELFEQLLAGSIDHYQLEKRFFRSDGSLIWGRLTISISESSASRFVIAMVEDLSKEGTGQETLAGRLIEAQEKERARISRELHDDIHQKLLLLSISLDQAQEKLPQAAAAESRQNLSEARDQLLNVINDVQALSYHLHSAKLEYLGLQAAAASFCRDVSRQYKVKIDFKSEEVPNELPTSTALCLYRVLQEALHNAMKHSDSERVEVSLSSESNHIKLIVRDWGIGFDLVEIRRKAGLGLASMKERLSLVNGELAIESRHQQGTTICARVPLNERANSATSR